MRAFSLVTLSPEAFDDFSAHHADGNFQQTSAAGRLRAGQGIEVEYLGVQENGTIVAGALFETHRSRLSTFSVVHDGPLCDYRDRELTEYFMTNSSCTRWLKVPHRWKSCRKCHTACMTRVAANCQPTKVVLLLMMPWKR